MATTSYQYDDLRPQIFTDEGQREFLKVRDHVHKLLKLTGAIRAQEAMGDGESWVQMSYLDRLVELGEIREILQKDLVFQKRIFVSAKG
jgi:hypothetical protein